MWGNVLALFDHVYGYDKVVHFMLPCGTAMLLYVTLGHLRLVPTSRRTPGCTTASRWSSSRSPSA